MKKNTEIFLLVLALCVLTSIATAQQNKAEQMYQQALYEMEGRGNYAKAIDMFNQVVAQFPKEKSVAAKALLRVGICQEKLGNHEAQKVYERVIKDYADQHEVVAEARARLDLIAGKENKEFSVRRVKEGTDMCFYGAVSPDGRYLSYTDWESGDLAIYEIATGNKRRLTNKGSWDISNEFAYFSRWSPDSKQVVYDWYTVESLMELRIVGLDSSKPRILYSNKEVVWSQTYGWSPDSKQILASLFKENGQNQIVLVSIEDESVRVLKTLEQGFWDHMNFSPDGRYIVYDFQQKDNSPESDISLLSTDGTREIPLVEHPANDYVLGWAPDGKNILFVSDRRNSSDAWVIQFSDGKVQGAPKLVTSNFGKADPMGFTQKGSFYYDIYDNAMDIYLAELDPETGKVIDPPKKQSTRFEGSLTQPEYSPDGKYIAYNSVSSSHSTLSIQSLETGKIQEFPSKLIFRVNAPRWSPDGRSILVGGWDWKGKKGIYCSDTQSGIFTLMVPPAKLVTESSLGQHEWSRDGKAIFLERFSGNKYRTIMLREIESGTEKELYHEESNSRGLKLSCSPDGNWLAILTMGIKEYVLRIMPAAGGEYRELYRFNTDNTQIYSQKLIWTPDGKFILFENFQSAEKKFSLWRIPIEGGEPQKLGLESDSYIVASIHPDGRHIVFSSPASTGENSGNWVMENFLPKEKSETSNQFTLRKLDYAQLNTPFAFLSPDGKKMAYVVYVGGSPKQIEILDLESETAKVLVDSGVGGQSSLVWSPKSDKIAYTFLGKELHVRDIDGTNSRVLLKNSGNQIYPTDWSRDGKKILCFFEVDDWTTRIGTVTSDGKTQFLGSGNSIEFRSEPKFSPDGSYIVCSFGKQEGNTDIYVWTADGSHKVRVTEHPGRDENPVWSPDGKYLVFLSDRNRSVDLWGVQMKDGKTVGAPFVIKRELGWRTRINDFTASGKLSLLMLGGAEPGNLFSVPVDQESGSISGTIAPISVYPTDHTFPRYSPNGKMIAYQSRRGQLGWPKLFVLDEKGAERELPLRGHYIVNLAWHPENQSLFFAGFDKDFKAGIYEVSLGKDEIRSVYSGDTIDMKTFNGALININLLPDAGKMMFFRTLGKGDVEVLTCDPDGKQPAVVLSRVNMPVWGLPSPNGENICYRVGDSLKLVSVSNGVLRNIGSASLNLEAAWAPNSESLMFREGFVLKIFSLKENTSHTLYQAPAGKTIGGMEIYATSWSLDGSRFIFTERDTSALSISPQKLFLINPGDGSLKTLGETPEGYRLSELRWSPDGNKIVATGKSISSEHAPGYEYWVMENFLPK
jgi:Tol biopolymer transport system component